jgi:hypothetical protein
MIGGSAQQLPGTMIGMHEFVRCRTEPEATLHFAAGHHRKRCTASRPTSHLPAGELDTMVVFCCSNPLPESMEELMMHPGQRPIFHKSRVQAKFPNLSFLPQCQQIGYVSVKSLKSLSLNESIVKGQAGACGIWIH